MAAASPYSLVDRCTHRLAFRDAVQETVSDLESSLFGNLWRGQPLRAPVFVTSLPRAGTTLLLDILARVDGVATHTYRDMPFPRAPVLWDRLSRPFRRARPARERAHGDGMTISPDSPEAFEEVLWRTRFPGHFGADGIRLCERPDPGFAAELGDHMRRVIVARAGRVRHDGRYLSKNNANVARLPLLRAAFPDAKIIVPLRDPVGQAASMHRQHMMFRDRHREDPFSREYMRDLGHFEFGALHRPILFDGVAGLRARSRPEEPEYWIGYWSAALAHLAGQDGVEFLDLAAFCRNGRRAFGALLERLGLPRDTAALDSAEGQIRPLRDAPRAAAPRGAREARELFDALRERAALVGA